MTTPTDVRVNVQTDTPQNGSALLQPEKKSKKPLAVRAAVLAVVLTLGVVYMLTMHSEWNMIVVPVLSGLAVALTWALLQIFCFSVRPQRYTKSFARPIYYAMLLPLWAVYCLALYFLPTDTTQWYEPLIDALTSLLLAVFFFAAPVVAAVFGLLSITFGVKHLRSTPKGETLFYREGPLVIASLLCALVFSLCVFGVFGVFVVPK